MRCDQCSDDATKQVEFSGRYLCGKCAEAYTTALEDFSNYTKPEPPFPHELMPDNIDVPGDTIESVDVIASGYEWSCPNCEHLNKEIEYRQDYNCERCHQAVQPREPEHAYG